MTDLEQFLGLKPALFAPNSRYYGLPTATLQAADAAEGRIIVYLRRRFIPPAGPPAGGARLAVEHGVLKGDRLDNLAAGAYGDPELYWRIADANVAMAPDELTETSGRVLRITSQG